MAPTVVDRRVSPSLRDALQQDGGAAGVWAWYVGREAELAALAEVSPRGGR
jgi:hypothetical protein